MSFELTFWRDDALLGSAVLAEDPERVTRRDDLKLRPATDQVRLRSSDPRHAPRARLVVLGVPRCALDAQRSEAHAPLAFLELESGAVELCLEIERRQRWQLHSTLLVPLVSTPELEALRLELQVALEHTSRGLARGLVGVLDERLPAAELDLLGQVERLRRFLTEFEAVAANLRPRARSVQSRQVQRQRWRPGDTLAHVRAIRFERLPRREGRGAGAAVRPLDFLSARPVTSFDTAEHRQLARSLRQLAARAQDTGRRLRSLQHPSAPGTERALSETERDRRSHETRLLERGGSTAARVAAGAARLREDEPWLRDVGQPRTPLSPTPTFRRVAEYAAAYELLRRWDDFAALPDETVLQRFRLLPELFELWVFLHCLRRALAMPGLVAQPEPAGSPLDLLRDLRRGDQFVLPLEDGGDLRLMLEPLIQPLHAGPSTAGLPYAASLTRGALRPDVWIERRRPRQPARALVVDAKCTKRFSRDASRHSIGDQLEEIRDYRTRVIDPRTGHQPVRALLQVHRDALAPPVCNVPQLLRGAAPREGFLMAAVGAVPSQVARLDELLARLLHWL